MAVIAYLYSVDPDKEGFSHATIGLRVSPAAGETIKLKDGRELRVIRVQHNELTGDEQIDIELGVREVSNTG